MRMAAPPLGVRGTISFGSVGVAATAVYFATASAGTGLGLKAYASSLVAYGVSSLLSYVGHRRLTFRSDAPVAETAPRFLHLTLAQYGLAVAIPAALTDGLGLPASVSYATVCIVAPVTSLLAMSRYVFRGPAQRAAAETRGPADV